MSVKKVIAATFTSVFFAGCFALFNDAKTVRADSQTVTDWATLSSTVASAQSGDIITLGGDITTEAMIEIKKGQDITIDLAGHALDRERTTAHADGHVIIVNNGGTLTLKSSATGKGVITGGFAYNGGGINNKGTLTVQNVMISGNSVGENPGYSDISNRGAGIYNSGSITMTDCEISGNTGNNKESNKGGGIYNDGGTITATNTTISSNTSCDGGGIYNTSDGSITLENSSVTGNNSTGHGGGGVDNYGTLSLNNSSVTGNTSVKNGGGIWSNGTINVSGKVTVEDNTSGTGTHNVYLKPGKTVNASGALDDSSYIGVTPEDLTAVVTSNWGDNSEDIIHFDNGMSTTLSGGEVKGGDVTYYSRAWNGSTVDKTEETCSETVRNLSENIGGGWYYVYGEHTLDRISISGGTVNIILADGADVTCEGIYVPDGATLNIYGQENDTGTLTANAGEEYQAGIGGNEETGHGTINIYGGTIKATGNDYGAGIGTGDEPGSKTLGNISIYGGNIVAQGGIQAAGIGGGNESSGARIYIFGGNIKATGEAGGGLDLCSGAGIGGGDDGAVNYIEINGGTIEATGKSMAAGIGGGAEENVNSGTIIINGGNVTANGGFGGAGIGSGYESDCGCDIEIYGGTVYAKGGVMAAGIGGGEHGHFEGTIIIAGGDLTVKGTGKDRGDTTAEGGAGIGSGQGGDMDGTIKISGGTLDVYAEHGAAVIGAGSEFDDDGASIFYSDGGECNGTITITGGYLTLYNDCRSNFSKHNKPAIIGHGVYGIEDGTLNLGDVWVAYPPEACNGEPNRVPTGDRESLCHTTKAWKIIIGSCDPHTSDGKYKCADCDEHEFTCIYCGKKATEAHRFNGNKCVDCGYVNPDIVKVTVDAGDGTGTAVSTWETKGDSYTLPDCSFKAPEGKVFENWIVQFRDTAYFKDAGETFTISAETTVIAQYRTLPRYSVTFKKLDGTPLQTVFVQEGQMPVYSGAIPTKETSGGYRYVFAGWSPEVVPAACDTEYTETYRVIADGTITYEITFVNDDGTVLWSSEVENETKPVYPLGTPAKASTAEYSYTFEGWKLQGEDDVLTEMPDATADATYVAVYTATTNKYTVRFVNEDGMELQSDVLEYGETPDYTGAAPLKASDVKSDYTFDGWTEEIKPVTGDAVYTAKYSATPRKYIIRYVNEDGTLLQSGEVGYGSMPSYTGATPVKDGDAKYTYTHLGWTPTVKAVDGEATYTATYSSTVNKYTVTFKNEDGTELQSDTLAYGETPAFKGETPTKAEDDDYTYSFAGWDAAVEKVTGDAVYTATYKAIEKTATIYTIKFVNDDGIVLQTVKVAKGDMPAYTLGTDPVKKADDKYTYEFLGWTPAIEKATDNAIYRAAYKATEKKQTQPGQKTTPDQQTQPDQKINPDQQTQPDQKADQTQKPDQQTNPTQQPDQQTNPAQPTQPTYTFIEGNRVYTQGSGEDIVTTIKCTVDDANSINRVLWVAVDGTQLTPGTHYTLKKGSTIVTLLGSYLDTLSAGEHTLLVNFTDGSVTTTFTVLAKETSGSSLPATGEEQNTTALLISMLIIAAGLGCAVYAVRTKKHSEEK